MITVDDLAPSSLADDPHVLLHAAGRQAQRRRALRLVALSLAARLVSPPSPSRRRRGESGGCDERKQDATTPTMDIYEISAA